MSQFRGFQCDACGQVIEDGFRTRYTQKFVGSMVQGEVVQDLCVTCVKAVVPQEEGALKPLRRRVAASADAD